MARVGGRLLFGIGGTPEGVITAAALKAMGGDLQGRLWPRTDEERDALIEEGFDLDKILSLDDLVSGNDCFFAATGITTGDLLRGVPGRQRDDPTQSLVMRSRSGTVRLIEGIHRDDKVESITSS